MSLADLKATFKGDLVFPEDADYSAAIARWSITAERKAAIVAFVKTDEDVGLAIKYAKANKLPIAIRGGGHNPAGTSSTEGGVVIDLSRHLAVARVDAEKKLVYVGGGALWKTVDEATMKHGLATVAGTVNHTGVGGLTLGGGYGWLSAQHGLALDNLAQATVVVASGEALVANETENPDLFWGIRGGGCNFGVVTEFVLRLHPQRATAYAGMIIFTPDKLETIVEVTGRWFKNASEKESAGQIVGTLPDGTPAIIMLLFYNGSEEEGRAVYKEFFDIGPIMDTTKEVPYEIVNSLQNQGTDHRQGFYFKGLSQHEPNYADISAAYKIALDTIKTKGVHMAVAFEYIPLNKINSVPREATAFRRDTSTQILIFTSWPGEKNDELVDGKTRVEIARDASNRIAEILTQGQKELSLGYTNYDVEAETSKDKAKSTFLENYPRLQKVKKQYDPENIFNKWFAITPA